MLTDGDYICRMVNLPGDVKGALRVDNDDFGNIYINDLLSPMAKRRAFLHEYRHLQRNDLYNSLSIKEVEG